MNIVIPGELTGQTTMASGARLAQGMQALADSFSRQAKKEMEDKRNLDAYIQSLEDEKKIAEYHDLANQQAQNMSYEELQTQREQGVDPYAVANRKAMEYLKSITDTKRAKYAASRMGYIQYKQDQKFESLMNHKRVSAGQKAYYDSFNTSVTDTASGFTPRTLDPDDQERNALLNNLDQVNHYLSGLQDFRAKTVAAVNAGLFTQHQAVEMERQYTLNTAVAIAKDNPKQAYRYLETMRDELGAVEYQRVKGVLNQVTKEVNVTNAVQNLQDQFMLNEPTGDWAGMQRHVFDKKNWESLGIESWEDAGKIMGTLHNAKKTMEVETKAKENEAAQKVWGDTIAPLLIAKQYTAASNAVKNSVLDDTTKAAWLKDVHQYMKSFKEPGGEGLGGKWFAPGKLPDVVVKDKTLLKVTLTEMNKIEMKTKPEEMGVALDTFYKNLNDLAAQRKKDGQKIYASDIYETGLKVFTDPAFVKGKGDAAEKLKRILNPGSPAQKAPAQGGKVDKTPVRKPGESYADFKARTGVKIKSEWDLDFSNEFGGAD